MVEMSSYFNFISVTSKPLYGHQMFSQGLKRLSAGNTKTQPLGNITSTVPLEILVVTEISLRNDKISTAASSKLVRVPNPLPKEVGKKISNQVWPVLSAMMHSPSEQPAAR